MLLCPLKSRYPQPLDEMIVELPAYPGVMGIYEAKQGGIGFSPPDYSLPPFPGNLVKPDKRVRDSGNVTGRLMNSVWERLYEPKMLFWMDLKITAWLLQLQKEHIAWNPEPWGKAHGFKRMKWTVWEEGKRLEGEKTPTGYSLKDIRTHLHHSLVAPRILFIFKHKAYFLAMDPTSHPEVPGVTMGFAQYSAIWSRKLEKCSPFRLHAWKVPSPLGTVCLERKTSEPSATQSTWGWQLFTAWDWWRDVGCGRRESCNIEESMEGHLDGSVGEVSGPWFQTLCVGFCTASSEPA